MIRHVLLASALAVSVAAPAFAKPAAAFMRDAVRGDISEATLGRLIEQRGASAQVRSFGRTLAADHSAGRVKADALARSLRITPPNSMMPEARTEYAKLQRLRGRAFDMEVRRYMINDHTKDIAEFTEQARSGDRRTADFARATLPTLRKHLRIAESIRS